MKIKSLTQKTMLEINDNDVLVIEDEHETKHVTVADLREYLMLSGVTETKKLINQTLDAISESLLSIKFVMQETKAYEVVVTIVDTENVHLNLKDTSTGNFLTGEELVTLLFNNDYTIQMSVDNVYEVPDIVPVIVETEEDVPIGVIKAHFANLAQNAVAVVTYSDIEFIIPETETIKYQFITSSEAFTNNVPYVEDVE
jgi:hypothetical protein